MDKIRSPENGEVEGVRIGWFDDTRRKERLLPKSQRPPYVN